VIKQAYQCINEKADVVIDEGAGSWLVPFNKTQTMADVVSKLQLEVIQVVGLRLGCLNHALLTSESIAAHKLTQVGWIANQLTNNMHNPQENIDVLQQKLDGKCLGVIPHLPQHELKNITRYLTINNLL